MKANPGGPVDRWSRETRGSGPNDAHADLTGQLPGTPFGEWVGSSVSRRLHVRVDSRKRQFVATLRRARRRQACRCLFRSLRPYSVE